MRHRHGVSSVLCFGVALAAVLLGSPARAEVPRSTELSRGWTFQPDPDDAGMEEEWQRPEFDRSGWRAVRVPATWDSYDATMDGYEGVGWYALRLPAEAIASGAWQRLRFGRVNHRAIVWVNGRKVAEDSLGYVPFECALTPVVTPGRPAWIVVRVENGTRDDWLPGSTTVEWVQYGGLLEPVELLTTPPAFLAAAAVRARPEGTEGRVRVTVEVANRGEGGFQGRVRMDCAGRSAEAPVGAATGSTVAVELAITLPNARTWSPDRPALYELRVRLLDGDRTQDEITERFGVRSIEASGRELRLNGVPLRIRGVNRYDEFPGVGVVAGDAAIRRDLRAIQSAGANFVRVHYPQSPRTLRIADEVGLLFMEEVPLNWWRAAWHRPAPPEYQNDRIIDSAEDALERMVRRDVNHPSVIAWSMANECRTYDSLGVRAMERMLRRARTLDDSRLLTFVANRNYDKNSAFAMADFVAVNLYYGMWEGDLSESVADMDSTVRRPTHEALGEIARLFPEKPVLLSEFGTIGMPGSGGDLRLSEDYQAAYLRAVWRAVRETPEICGGVVWCWADYRHRRGFTNDYPAYFGPFGLVTLDRRPKKALGALVEAWREDAGR